jgi:hypothetical protein
MLQLLANLIAATALVGAFAAVTLAVAKVLIALAATGSAKSDFIVVSKDNTCRYCGAILAEDGTCKRCGAVKQP